MCISCHQKTERLDVKQELPIWSVYSINAADGWVGQLDPVSSGMLSVIHCNSMHYGRKEELMGSGRLSVTWGGPSLSNCRQASWASSLALSRINSRFFWNSRLPSEFSLCNTAANTTLNVQPSGLQHSSI